MTQRLPLSPWRMRGPRRAAGTSFAALYGNAIRETSSAPLKTVAATNVGEQLPGSIPTAERAELGYVSPGRVASSWGELLRTLPRIRPSKARRSSPRRQVVRGGGQNVLSGQVQTVNGHLAVVAAPAGTGITVPLTPARLLH